MTSWYGPKFDLYRFACLPVFPLTKSSTIRYFAKRFFYWTQTREKETRLLEQEKDCFKRYCYAPFYLISSISIDIFDGSLRVSHSCRSCVVEGDLRHRDQKKYHNWVHHSGDDESKSLQKCRLWNLLKNAWKSW